MKETRKTFGLLLKCPRLRINLRSGNADDGRRRRLEANRTAGIRWNLLLFSFSGLSTAALRSVCVVNVRTGDNIKSNLFQSDKMAYGIKSTGGNLCVRHTPKIMTFPNKVQKLETAKWKL